jgi:Fe-S cluster assembly iron-binding protein IscA
MRALRRGLLVATICLAVSVFLSAGVSHAKSGSEVKVEVEAELEPCGALAPATSPCATGGTIPEPGAEGEAKHEKETKKGVVKKDEFKGEVRIPVDPASVLGIVDEAAAEGADVRLILSRAGVDIAECRLAFDEIEEEDDDDEVQAEFKVDVRIKKGAVQAKKGECDIDLLTAGIQSGVPDAQADDVATARLVVGGTPTDFLQGTFDPD